MQYHDVTVYITSRRLHKYATNMPQKQYQCVLSCIIMSPITRISTQSTTKMTKLGRKGTPERYNNGNFPLYPCMRIFSFIKKEILRCSTWPNLQSEANSYYKISPYMNWVLDADICPEYHFFLLHFAVYVHWTAWQRKFARQWVLNINMRFKWFKDEMSATFITCIL